MKWRYKKRLIYNILSLTLNEFLNDKSRPDSEENFIYIQGL